MSCKLVRSGAPVASTPLFGRPKQDTPGTIDKWEPSSPEDDPRGVEIRRLRTEIAKLQDRITAHAQQAHDNGYREGEAAGLVRAEEASRPVFEKLAGAMVDIASLRKRLRQETEKDLVTLALAIARRVLHREIAVDPGAVEGLVRAALERVQAREITQVRIYPGHEDVVRRCLAGYHATNIELICDPSLHPGDVSIATKRGDLQASIETQLREIERGLTDRI